MGKKKKQEKLEKQKKQKKKEKKLSAKPQLDVELWQKEELQEELTEEPVEKPVKKTAEKLSENNKSNNKRNTKKNKMVPEMTESAEVAEILKVFADASRLQIMDLLSQQELCATELLKSMNIVQSTLSHHMKVLTEAGIVVCKKQGRRVYYSIDREILVKVSEYIIKWG